MAGGSQLSQLKSALLKAGVTGNLQQGKKRKRSASTSNDKDKRAAKLEEIHRRLNPFDTKVTKLKHDIGGRKVKGVVGKPARSKLAGIEHRKRTLLKEFQEKGRAGGIVDRRFGENDPTMSLEERMLERFTRERQRASKGVMFNLEDGDELTHYGQSLSKLDDFDNVGLDLDEDDEDNGKINADIVERAHFGGFEEEEGDQSEEPAKKSKSEVMAEVIAKSKEHKLLRQMERDDEDNIRHELDQEFDSLRSIIYAPDPSTTGNHSNPLGHVHAGDAPQLMVPDKSEDYDQHVRELAFDKRAKPKDRTKTEEELALEKKEALEKAERHRQKRMLGLDESNSEDDGKYRRKRKRGGDDLEDDFSEDDEWGGLGAGLTADVEAEEDSGNDEGDREKNLEAKSDSSEASEEEQEELVRAGAPSHGTGKTQQELPFTFPCPSTHEEFLEIVEDVNETDIPTVVERIRALYHTGLSSDNKFKLQTLITVLMDHVIYVSSHPKPGFILISSLLPHIIALTKAYPVQAAEYFIKKLVLMHKNLKRGLSQGPLDTGSKTWPGIPELTLLRIIGSIWSTSDQIHAVVSPSRILMGAYLGLGRVRSIADLCSGLFLCTLFFQFEELSKRFVPEAINFLINAVLHIAPHRYKDVATVPGSFPSPDFRSDQCRTLSLDPAKCSCVPPQKADLTALMSLDKPTEQAQVDLLSLSISLLTKYADMYKSLHGFIELYEPILEIFESLDITNLSKPLQAQILNSTNLLSRLLKFSHQARQPLCLQVHKPIPIPTYHPKFDVAKSSYLRRQDPDQQRNETAKLRNQYKQERKGAIRELRKDAKFLASVEREKEKEKDRIYHERMKHVFGSIEGERAEEKAMERQKAREKRRASRK